MSSGTTTKAYSEKNDIGLWKVDLHMNVHVTTDDGTLRIHKKELPYLCKACAIPKNIEKLLLKQRIIKRR